MITQAPRGTSDWFGDKMRTRTQVEAMARNLCEKFNIKEVITPVFEHTVLFQRGVGETTDVVQKEMYTFVDKGGRSITLKPEGTAGAIRAMLRINYMQNHSRSRCSILHRHFVMRSRKADDFVSIINLVLSLSDLQIQWQK